MLMRSKQCFDFDREVPKVNHNFKPLGNVNFSFAFWQPFTDLFDETNIRSKLCGPLIELFLYATQISHLR
jgi:hypothetical protein